MSLSNIRMFGFKHMQAFAKIDGFLSSRKDDTKNHHQVYPQVFLNTPLAGPKAPKVYSLQRSRRITSGRYFGYYKLYKLSNENNNWLVRLCMGIIYTTQLYRDYNEFNKPL